MSKTQSKADVKTQPTNPTVERFNTIRHQYAERFKQGRNYSRALWDTIMDASHCVGREDWESTDYWLDQFERIVVKRRLGETWRDDGIGDYQRDNAVPPFPASVTTQGELEDWRRAEYVRLNPDVGAS